MALGNLLGCIYSVGIGEASFVVVYTSTNISVLFISPWCQMWIYIHTRKHCTGLLIIDIVIAFQK